jgi:hypothetical protein
MKEFDPPPVPPNKGGFPKHPPPHKEVEEAILT